jgi:Dynamin GTPase effector domain
LRNGKKYPFGIKLHSLALLLPSTLLTYLDSRQNRLRDALKGKVVKSQGGSVELVNLSAVIGTSNMSNEENLIQHIHDILRSYYKVARKRIVDVLCMQAANYHLLTGPDTPLTILTPEFIRTISLEEMESIAGENPILTRKRQELTKTIKDLEKGKKILM